VSHQKLFHKLSFYGVKTTTLKDYLTDRTQQLVINNVTSNPCPVLFGIPQGSVLSPLLFLLYINDFPKGISSTVKLYADDSRVYCVICTNDDIKALQSYNDTLIQ